jgi:K+-transporting ATPase ATPase C chain
MLRQIKTAVICLVAFSIITGVIYPLVLTGIAAIAFPGQASGSMIVRDGRAIGSELIAQPFTDAKYFWPRPSAANYDGASSSGSNLGPTAPALHDAVRERVAALRAADPGNEAPIPVDLVTASASGLDPHITPAAAEYQVRRVARARGISPDRLRELIAQCTEGRTFGVLGEPRVNALKLNLALDAK